MASSTGAALRVCSEESTDTRREQMRRTYYIPWRHIQMNRPSKEHVTMKHVNKNLQAGIVTTPATAHIWYCTVIDIRIEYKRKIIFDIMLLPTNSYCTVTIRCCYLIMHFIC